MGLHLHNIDEERKTVWVMDSMAHLFLVDFYLNVCLLIAFIMVIFLCLGNNHHILLGTHRLNCEHESEVRATETASRNHLSS